MRIRLFSATVALVLACSANLPASGADGTAPAPEANARGAATTFVVKFRVKPGQNAAFEQAFREMQNGVRAKEPGNVYYDLFVTADDPQTYVIVERYRDASAVAAHGKTEHAGKLLAALRDLTEGRPEAERLVLVAPK